VGGSKRGGEKRSSGEGGEKGVAGWKLGKGIGRKQMSEGWRGVGGFAVHSW